MVVFTIGEKEYAVALHNWGGAKVAKGEKVTVIYNPDQPDQAALYSFFAYWLQGNELLLSAVGFAGLFILAMIITGTNEPPDPYEPTIRKRRYKD